MIEMRTAVNASPEAFQAVIAAARRPAVSAEDELAADMAAFGAETPHD